MSHGGGDPAKVIRAALIANFGIAVAKFIAAYSSDSTAMLAEGVHSVADTMNQALLFVGLRLATKRDPRYPLGRAAESYFWSFVVALMLFFLGGVYAIYEGVHKLQHPSPVGSPLAPVIVLVVSLALEGGSFLIALKEFNRQRGKTPFFKALFEGKDPVIPVVLLEDSGAMIGLLCALIAVVLTWLTGSSIFDSVGSIVIGVLLAVIGVLLAKDTKSLLIGEGVTDETKALAIELAEKTAGVERVTQLLSLHLGPDTVLLALKVRFAPALDLKGVEDAVNRLEENIREKLPIMKRIFVEADSRYDPTLDPSHDG